MEITAHCNSSCCPKIVFNEKDFSQPLLIKDDFSGSIPLTLREFDQLSKHVANIKESGNYPVVIRDRQFFIYGYKTDGPYISIRLVDGTSNIRKVRDISFDHWQKFTEAIAKHCVIA